MALAWHVALTKRHTHHMAHTAWHSHHHDGIHMAWHSRDVATTWHVTHMTWHTSHGYGSDCVALTHGH